jgi:hypothetical protein
MVSERLLLTGKWKLTSNVMFLCNKEGEYAPAGMNRTTGRSYICWPVHCSSLHSSLCTTGCEAHMNFPDESVYLMANNIWNWGKLLTLWTTWRHYVSQCVEWFMHGNLWFVSSEWQLSAQLAICFLLQLVSSVFYHGAVYFRAMCISVWHLREIRIC